MTKRPTRAEQIARMPPADRLEIARIKAEALVSHCLEVERIHANNRHLIFRSIFDHDLNQTMAGNAYEALRITSFSFEVLRLMALWDKPADNVISIPEVMALIADEEVIDLARTAYMANYTAQDHMRFPRAAGRFERALRNSRELSCITPNTHRFKSLKRHRNKFYAHNLSDPSITPKFGYERKLLGASEQIVSGLRTVLSSAGLNFRESRQACARHADEFWHGVQWHPTSVLPASQS